MPVENLYSVEVCSLVKVDFAVSLSSIDAQYLNPQLAYPLLAYSQQAPVQTLHPLKTTDFN